LSDGNQNKKLTYVVVELNLVIFQRFQAAAYQPFFRSHSEFDYPRREPYLLPEENRSIVREAIRKRYSYLPMWYTMFYEHERNGKPVMRPMLSEYPKDKNVFKLDDQYMLSDLLLVRPVLEKGVKQVNVYFPSVDGGSNGELWYDTDDFTVIDSVGIKSIPVDEKKVPVYQKGGSIIPKKETIRQSSVFMKEDPITLIVALDKNQSAHGTLFIDDEKSFEYRRGKYLYIKFEFRHNQLSLKFVDAASYTTNSKLEKIVVIGTFYTVKQAKLETGDGELKDLKITNASEKMFVIESSDLSLMSEWTILVSGATENILCGSLLIASVFVNFIKSSLL
jgi:mannosyl-oligosaccharide alpha-1,3-glucosidase